MGSEQNAMNQPHVDRQLSDQQQLHGSEIFVVDDDEMMRDTLSAVLAPEGCRVTCFAEGQSFLAAARSRTPACILLDVNMPDRSGLDIPTAVNAIKGGALDFIEKPFDAAAVVARVREAINAWARRALLPEVQGAEHLTPREREVLLLVTSGASNKEAGRTLSISPRTVEVHRARIMDKLGAKNAADLVRLVLRPGQQH
jgi:two-component system response regulator FixJ